uniref:Uncharacterized protein n=1 Tax=Clastoptera arizonana TaxID=38151 RepID=A0A1B6E304_9HEMI
MLNNYVNKDLKSTDSNEIIIKQGKMFATNTIGTQHPIKSRNRNPKDNFTQTDEIMETEIKNKKSQDLLPIDIEMFSPRPRRTLKSCAEPNNTDDLYKINNSASTKQSKELETVNYDIEKNRKTLTSENDTDINRIINSDGIKNNEHTYRRKSEVEEMKLVESDLDSKMSDDQKRIFSQRSTSSNNLNNIKSEKQRKSYIGNTGERTSVSNKSHQLDAVETDKTGWNLNQGKNAEVDFNNLRSDSIKLYLKSEVIENKVSKSKSNESDSTPK